MDARLSVHHFGWEKWPDGVVPRGITPWDETNPCALDPADPELCQNPISEP